MKLIFMLLAAGAFAAYGETARIRALLLDATTGEPITGRVVTADFGSRGPGSQSVTERKEGVTDEHGYCAFTGHTNKRDVGCIFWSCKDYYRCEADTKFTGVSLLPFNRLQPDNQVVTLAVQRVEHPIPLHITRLRTPHDEDWFKANGNELKFDLLASDWLPPLGSGTVADVVFTRRPRQVLRTGRSSSGHMTGEFYRAELEISFPGKGNGIQEISPWLCAYFPVRTAPEDGYGASVTACQWTDDNLQIQHSWDVKKVYCFRIRSAYDSDGKLVAGNYGKIYGGLRGVYSGDDSEPIGGVRVDFMVNLEPLSRNLEWDQKHNLNKREKADVGNLLP